MKFIPYFVAKDGDWWGAIDLSNRSDQKQSVTITEREHVTGKRLNTLVINLEPKYSYLIAPKHKELTQNQRLKLEIMCHDDVIVSGFQSQGTGGWALKVFDSKK